MNPDETPEVLATLDEADAAPESEDVSVEELRQNVTRWARDERQAEGGISQKAPSS